MIRLTWHRRLVCILAGGSVGFSGCALRMPPYPVHPARSYVHRASQGAVDVAIHPITSRVESRKYFGTNLMARDILAILVVVDNHSASSVVLDPAQCELAGLPDRADDRQLPGTMPGQMVALFVSSMLGMRMMFDSVNIRSNLHVKELRRQTLSPGQSTQGFLYFRLPARPSGGKVPTPWQVKVAVSKLGAAETSHTSLAFDWER